MSHTILLVEDDTTISSLVAGYLEHAGHSVVPVFRGDEAMTAFKSSKPALVVLDLNLPGLSGFDVCRDIRAISDVPVLVLSARSGEDDRVRSLELWADDYVGKPFSARELVARINRHLARATPAQELQELELGGIRIVFSEYCVYAGGEPIHFTKTEFEILARLAQSVSQIVERKVLMNEIIGYDHYLSDRTIDTHIKNIRKKLEWFLNIETIRAVGYRLTV